MPELPEVETLKRRLSEVLPGKTIARVEVFHPKSFIGQTDQLLGVKIEQVNRQAKVLNFQLSNQTFLMTHLKMTGQLIVVDQQQRYGGGHPNADWTQDLPGKHTRIQYTFTDQSQLFFNDQRIFGWMKLVDQLTLNQEMVKYGPDIIDPKITPDYLHSQFQRKTIPIKQALMDSAIVAGMGNIYACEALFAAKINPIRPAKSLSLIEIERLLTQSRRIILQAITLGGTTFDGKYVDIRGLEGGFQTELKVYGRENQSCLVCQQPLKKIKLGGRGMYFCPVCQA